jgi:hypothetical protein
MAFEEIEENKTTPLDHILEGKTQKPDDQWGPFPKIPLRADSPNPGHYGGRPT